MVANAQRHEVFIKSSIEKIWKCITQATHIKQWYAFDGATIDLRPGGEITFQWEEHGKYYGEVNEVAPEKQLIFRYVPFEADTKPKASNALLITITLQPKNGGTSVQLIEAGYNNLGLPDKEKEENYTINQGAWENSLELLKELCEGEPA